MFQLINISDVRKYRQLGKQVNSDSFSGHVLSIQENQLTEILGDALVYDFFNQLENGFTPISETFLKISNTKFTIKDSDYSNLIGMALKINSLIFVICDDATFDGTDTEVTISGYDLPDIITNVEFAIETKYVNLLNGVPYNLNGNTIDFKGLRPFIIWSLLISYIVDGNLKQSDVGNVNILGDNFSLASTAQLNIARSEYQQNANREQNRITNFISANSSLYNFAETKNPESIISGDFFVV